MTNLRRGGTNERAWGYLVSGNYFDVLGVKPILGRGFLPDEDKTQGAKPVTVLSYATWQKLFAGNPSVIGRTVILNGRPYTIVGVAPKGFIGTEVAFAPQMWVPIMMAKEIEIGSHWLDSRDSDNLFTVGRLKTGVSTEKAQAALAVLTAQLGKEYPKEDAGRGVRLIPPGLFIPSVRDSVFAFSSVLAVVGGLVLLLACVNLANLLLARATERRKEIAIRLAVGATRWRLVRQLLTESVMLSLAGGALGLLLGSAQTLEKHMEIPLFPARMAADALGSFGVLALFLAAIGIYGVMSYVVAGRRREIGLRMALGAQTVNIRSLILRQGMLLAAIGGGIGLAVSFGATRLLDVLLYGVSAADPMTFVMVTILLGSIALLACWFPAHRATRVNPIVALRAE